MMTYGIEYLYNRSQYNCHDLDVHVHGRILKGKKKEKLKFTAV